MQFFPSASLRQNSSILSAPGKRPDTPITATSVSEIRGGRASGADSCEDSAAEIERDAFSSQAEEFVSRGAVEAYSGITSSGSGRHSSAMKAASFSTLP